MTHKHLVLAFHLAAVLGCLAAYLAFNFNPAKMFLGNADSLSVGFMIAITPILPGSAKNSMARPIFWSPH